MATSPVWHVLGAGSIGLLCAFHLRQSGFAVNLILRSPSAVDKLVQNELRIQVLESWRQDKAPLWKASLPVQTTSLPSRSEAARDSQFPDALGGGGKPGLAGGPIRQLLIATKAQDAVPALRSVLPYLDAGCRCILLQNGVLAVADELQWELGSELGLAPTPPQQHDPRGASIDAGPGPRSSDRTDAASRNVRLYVGSVTHGCYRGAPTADEQPDAAAPSSLGPASSPSALGVVHAGLGSITIGPLAPLLAAAAAALHSAGTAAPPGGSPPPHGDVGGPGSSAPSLGTAAAAAVAEGDDAAFLHELAASVPGLAFRTATEPGGLLRELLAKLAANCAINPLTALLGCLNGALAEDPHARRLMGQVCRELTAVFGPAAFLPDSAQQGVLTGPAAAQGEELRQVGTQSFSEAGAERALLEWVLGVATATAGNRSSMLQDVVSGRPTEADYLSGWVLWVAAARGVATPVIATLHGLVKAKEGLREL